VCHINWRHTTAEIDIIAQKRRKLWSPASPLVFFEVKYRQSDSQGMGLDYITPKKFAQMQYAAELYVSIEQYDGEYTLGAIELQGNDFTVTNLLVDLTL
jgi:Holliday junction resolvase-like predicted endonuclease